MFGEVIVKRRKMPASCQRSDKKERQQLAGIYFILAQPLSLCGENRNSLFYDYSAIFCKIADNYYWYL